MKTVITVIVLFAFLIYPQLIAQPLNNSFEEWANGDPVSWLTTDIPGYADCVTQSSDAQSGSSSARLEVINLSGNPYAPRFNLYRYERCGSSGFSKICNLYYVL